MSVRQKVKELVKRTPLGRPLRRFRDALELEWSVIDWRRKGRPAPPPHVVKERTLRAYAKRHQLRVLVETGTYLGDTVAAMLPHFDRIYSIELSRELYQRAAQRFASDRSVELICGDSGTELERLVARLDQPALFWLDGHYSAGITARGDKDTPVLDELCHILSAQEARHVIIIDDAREFGVNPGYPTAEKLTAFIRSMRPSARIDIKDDSVRITP